MILDPSRPWRVDPRWRSGFIFRANVFTYVCYAWVVAVPLSATCGFALFLEISQHQIALGKILVAFFGPLAGGALLLAGHLTALFLRYGSPQLALAEMPVVPGKALRGIILCKRRVYLKGSYRVMVKCQSIRQLARKDIPVAVFQAIACVSADQALSSPRYRVAIPVDLAIPADVPDLLTIGAEGPVQWILTVRAATPGVKFEAEFDLPVFRVENESLIEKRPEASR